MRYEEVLRRYLAVRDASSREWGIAPGVVMCVEIDMSVDAFMTSLVASGSSQRRTGPQLLRVTVVRVHPTSDDASKTFHATCMSPSDPGVDIGLSEDQIRRIGFRQGQIKQWIKSELAELPPSDSRLIADRLRGR